MRNIPTSKTLWEKTTEGWTESKFTEYYELSLEELINKVFKNDKKDAQKIMRSISANGKRKGSKSTKKVKLTNATTSKVTSNLADEKNATGTILDTLPETVFETLPETVSETMIKTVSRTVSETALETVPDTTESIESLEVQIEELKQRKIALEGERKKQLSRRRALCGILERLDESLAKIEEQLTDELGKFVEISKELSMVPQELNKNKSDISEIDAQISIKQERLISLSVVKLYYGSVSDERYCVNKMKIDKCKISDKVTSLLSKFFDEFTKLNLGFSQITEIARILIAVEVVTKENPSKLIELVDFPDVLEHFVKSNCEGIAFYSE